MKKNAAKDLRWKDVLQFVNQGNPEPDQRVERTEAEWRAQLSDHQFEIMRAKGTERAFTGALCESFEPGKYACAACHTLLFDSQGKFDSRSGWPSFSKPVKENAIKYAKDSSHGMIRVEIMCNTCDSHLGHVFPDGPEPTGLRYCVNSASLEKLK